MKFLLLLAALLPAALAIPKPGSCPPQPATVPDFDPVQVCHMMAIDPTGNNLIFFQYLGDWFTQQTTPAFFQPPTSTCQRAQYGDNGDGTVSVYNTATRITGNVNEICGFAVQVDPENNPGILAVTLFFEKDGAVRAYDGNYLVLDTDYTSFASVYSCTDFGDSTYSDIGWVLTREPVASEATVEMAYDAFRRANISLDIFEEMEHPDGCVYDAPSPSCKDDI